MPVFAFRTMYGYNDGNLVVVCPVATFQNWYAYISWKPGSASCDCLSNSVRLQRPARKSRRLSSCDYLSNLVRLQPMVSIGQ